MGKLPAGSPTKNHHVLSIEDNSVHALEARRKVRKKSSGRLQDAGKTGSRVGTPPPTTNRGSHRILAGEEKSSEHSCFAGFLLAEDRGFELARRPIHLDSFGLQSQHLSENRYSKYPLFSNQMHLNTPSCTHGCPHGTPRLILNLLARLGGLVIRGAVCREVLETIHRATNKGGFHPIDDLAIKPPVDKRGDERNIS